MPDDILNEDSFALLYSAGMPPNTAPRKNADTGRGNFSSSHLIKNEREQIPAPAPMQNFSKNNIFPLISLKKLLIELISLS